MPKLTGDYNSNIGGVNGDLQTSNSLLVCLPSHTRPAKNWGYKMHTWKYIVVVIIFTILTYQTVFAATASYYTYESCVKEGTSGVWTASGERFDENDMTCAMRRRDWGTMFRVTNLANGKSVIVRLNDFGPNKKLHDKGRIIDLSKGAFEKIADLKTGVINVKVEEIK